MQYHSNILVMFQIIVNAICLTFLNLIQNKAYSYDFNKLFLNQITIYI